LKKEEEQATRERKTTLRQNRSKGRGGEKRKRGWENVERGSYWGKKGDRKTEPTQSDLLNSSLMPHCQENPGEEASGSKSYADLKQTKEKV